MRTMQSLYRICPQASMPKSSLPPSDLVEMYLIGCWIEVVGNQSGNIGFHTHLLNANYKQDHHSYDDFSSSSYSLLFVGPSLKGISDHCCSYNHRQQHGSWNPRDPFRDWSITRRDCAQCSTISLHRRRRKLHGGRCASSRSGGQYHHRASQEIKEKDYQRLRKEGKEDQRWARAGYQTVCFSLLPDRTSVGFVHFSDLSSKMRALSLPMRLLGLCIRENMCRTGMCVERLLMENRTGREQANPLYWKYSHGTDRRWSRLSDQRYAPSFLSSMLSDEGPSVDSYAEHSAGGHHCNQRGILLYWVWLAPTRLVDVWYALQCWNQRSETQGLLGSGQYWEWTEEKKEVLGLPPLIKLLYDGVIGDDRELYLSFRFLISLWGYNALSTIFIFHSVCLLFVSRWLFVFVQGVILFCW